MKSCCFTGHRYIKEDKDLLSKLIISIESCINDGVIDFYSGGAIGWDTLCAKVVIELKKKYPNIRLNLILPCSEEEQTSNWNENQKLDYKSVLKSADTVEYTSNKYYNGCMKVRNARLIELSDMCICYYNTNNFRSGTGQTVRMAQKKGILIINLI